VETLMTIESFTKNNRAKESMDSSFIEKSSIQRNYTLLNSRSIIIDGKHAHKITIKIFKIMTITLITAPYFRGRWRDMISENNLTILKNLRSQIACEANQRDKLRHDIRVNNLSRFAPS
jgi:hypothetical protein